jgi:hypothetical protein
MLTDVSEERAASIFRVKAKAAGSPHRLQPSTNPHGVTLQKAGILVPTAMGGLKSSTVLR